METGPLVPEQDFDQELETHIDKLVEGLAPSDARLAREIVMTAVKMAREQVTRLDRKIINSAMKELRYAFRVFSPYRGVRKVTMFGSARTKKGDPTYRAALAFSRAIADRGWMVITGAGPGIMEAGSEGAGGERSFGVNILLPFEADPNPYIAGDPKLINFKYFFTRKLMFVKEADAFVLLPGGFGTLDEVLELLTLVQTGKSPLRPILMLDHPDGRYWERFVAYLRESVLANGYISERDLSLFRHVSSPEDAVIEIENFYRVFHSQRIVGRQLVLRLKRMPSDELLATLSEEFAHIMNGEIKKVEVSKVEIGDDDQVDLPRIAFEFDWAYVGDLRRLIDKLNSAS